MISVRGSFLLLQNFTLKVCIRRFVSGFACLVFVMVTTHLIVMEPVFQNHRARFNLRKYRHLHKRSVSELDFHLDYNETLKHCKNFVVFDASLYSGNLTFLESQPVGWCAIVVNLQDPLKLLTCTKCLILKDEWIESHVAKFVQKKLDASENLNLSSSQLSKMAAFLFVLLQKPKWIFVTDQTSQIPYITFEKVTGTEVKTGIVYQGSKEVFEPCEHFVDPVTWRKPGDYQVQGRYNIKVVSPYSVYYVMDSCLKPGINPDILKKSLDTEAPIPYLMPGTYGAIDFNNVLVPGVNAWTLVASLAATHKGSEQSVPPDAFDTKENVSTNNYGNHNSTSSNAPQAGDVERNSNTNLTAITQMSLMVQRLLWDSDTTIGFIPNSNQHSTSNKMTCHSCDAFSQLNATERKYYKALLAWRCDAFQGIENCFLNMTSNKILSSKPLEHLTHIWITLLKKYKIALITRVPFSNDKLNEKQSGIPLYYSPTGLVKNDSTRPNPFQNICSRHGIPYHSVIPEKYPMSKILLIIVFNFPFLVSHIPLLDYVYGRHFKHVLYCSENIADFEERYQKRHPNSPVNWIEIKHYMGYWGQNCMSAAIKMGYDVRGYLQIGDDVILNVWNLEKLPYHQPWFQSNMRVAHIDREIVPDVWINQYWWPWSQFSGKKSAVAAYGHLESMLSNPASGDRVSAFMENIYNITNCDRCFLYEASDIFYLPHELGANFTFFSDIFSYNKVFLEITIPTVLAGITSDREMYRLRGNYLWFHDRDRYPFVYTEFDHFYHAWKLSRFGDGREVQFFCRQFLSRIDRHLILPSERRGT